MEGKRFIFKVSMLVAAALMIAFSGEHAVADNWIDVVTINPPNPTNLDLIALDVSGYMPDPLYEFVGDQSDIIGNSVFLDTYFERPEGMSLPVLMPWSTQETISTLSADIYDLTVRAYSRTKDDPLSVYELRYTYATSFTVTPEPATIALLGLGGLAMLRKRRA